MLKTPAENTCQLKSSLFNFYITETDLFPQLHRDVKSARALIQFFAILVGVGMMLLIKLME